VKEETLVNIAALMSACGTYVGNDSGLTHLAAALGLRTVALFGPTDPAIWAPRGSRVQILRAVSGRWADLGVDEVEAALREPGSES
jgi:ADP-heptose:LPS heptosyltransferase